MAHELAAIVTPTAVLTGITEQNVRLNARHGVASVIAANLAVPFVGIFALKLGATNFQVALLSSAPAVVSLLVMIPGAMYVDRFERKKRVTALLFLANRVFYLLVALVPFLTEDKRAAALVVGVALMNLPGAVANVAWQSFIARVIPPRHRAQAFARRNRAMNVVGTAVMLAAGRALDVMRFPLGYQVMFLLAFVAALVEIRIFMRIEEPPPGPEETPVPGSAWSARQAVAGILAHPRFIRFTAASLVFHFMWQVAWPLFTLYQVKVLGANNLWISLVNLTYTGGSLFGYGFWAGFAERNGHLRTLVVSALGVFLVPLYYAFSHSLVTITALNLGTGVIFAGVTLALFNCLLEQAPAEHRTTYIAYYNTAVTATTVFAPLAGVLLLRFMTFFWAFIACAAARLLGTFCFYLVLRREEAEGWAPRRLGSPSS